MAAADPRRLHRPRGGEIGRAEADAVHARRGGGDGGDVVDALGGFQDGVDQDRLASCRGAPRAGPATDRDNGCPTAPRPSAASPRRACRRPRRRSRSTSSSTHGELSALMRVHSPVAPKSLALAMAMKPARAATLASTGMASSRLPSTTSTWRDKLAAPWRAPFRYAAARNGSSARADRQFAQGRRRADGQRLEELAWQFHAVPNPFQNGCLPFRGMQGPRHSRTMQT